jgi:hypothetical protein
MRPPHWYRSIPQPLRWAVGGALVLAAVGGVYGLAEAIRDYPLSSFFGVTLYVALLGGLAGFVLGMIVATARLALGLIVAAATRRSKHRRSTVVH